MVQSGGTKKKKATDFRKSKLKLGKGKQLPANATDTSFKARSIALPTQSIAVQKDKSLPATKRNLTLDQLVIQAKHYSAAVRKDSLLGIQELIANYPELLEPNLNTVVGATARNISDEDPAVRSAVYRLFTQMFSALSEEALIPHASVVLLHATSALSHIFAEIRVDSLQFLDLIMERAPSSLNRSRQRVLDGSSFVTEDAFDCFVEALSKRKRHGPMVQWHAVTDELAEADGADGDGVDWEFAQADDRTGFQGCTLQELEARDDSAGKRTDECFHCLLDLAQIVHSILVSTFLDTAPGVFTAGRPLGDRSGAQWAEVGLLRTLGELALSIYGPLLRVERGDQFDYSAEVGRKAGLVLEKLAIYFPFSAEHSAAYDMNVSIIDEAPFASAVSNQSPEVGTSAPRS
ncbi:hypothetical protein FRC04_007310 [Tulasnella sp. 424]|nr:hypothetical protein FRC04_007310 [Tulasnella sp. 424]